VEDRKTGLAYQYSYDSLGWLMSSSVSNSSGVILSTRQTYDASGNAYTVKYNDTVYYYITNL